MKRVMISHHPTNDKGKKPDTSGSKQAPSIAHLLVKDRKLKPKEKVHHLAAGECLCCGKKAHKVDTGCVGSPACGHAAKAEKSEAPALVPAPAPSSTESSGK